MKLFQFLKTLFPAKEQQQARSDWAEESAENIERAAEAAEVERRKQVIQDLKRQVAVSDYINELLDIKYSFRGSSVDNTELEAVVNSELKLMGIDLSEKGDPIDQSKVLAGAAHNKN